MTVTISPQRLMLWVHSFVMATKTVISMLVCIGLNGRSASVCIIFAHPMINEISLHLYTLYPRPGKQITLTTPMNNERQSQIGIYRRNRIKRDSEP